MTDRGPDLLDTIIRRHPDALIRSDIPGTITVLVPPRPDPRTIVADIRFVIPPTG